MRYLIATVAALFTVPAFAQDNVPSPPPAPVPYVVYNGCVGGGCVPAFPTVMYRPVMQYQPMQLQNVGVYERRYATPIRTMFFGRYRFVPQYAPATCTNGNCSQ